MHVAAERHSPSYLLKSAGGVLPSQQGRLRWHLGKTSPVRDAVDSLNGDQIAVDHIQNPVVVNSQPVIPAPVESSGGERVFGEACDGSADRADDVLVVHEAAG
jgi:hypothetical protein